MILAKTSKFYADQPKKTLKRSVACCLSHTLYPWFYLLKYSLYGDVIVCIDSTEIVKIVHLSGNGTP